MAYDAKPLRAYANFAEEVMDGYPATDLVVHAKGDLWLGVHRLAFHWTLIEWREPIAFGYAQRWCYDTDTGALAAIAEWASRDFEGEPTGWHRDPMSGRRRERGDPAREWIEG